MLRPYIPHAPLRRCSQKSASPLPETGYPVRAIRLHRAGMGGSWHPRVSMDRRSIRLRSHDYGGPGAYFVTVCARTHLFGRVQAGEVSLSCWGEISSHCWTELPSHFPHVRIDVFRVMPDHVHGILILLRRESSATAVGRISPGSLGAIIRSFKSAVAFRINALRGVHVGGIWQRNYFDEIIRNHDELERVRSYVRNNPARWNRNRTGKT
jgi:putative transposase